MNKIEANIHSHFSLKPYNTFGIDVKASGFSKFTSVDELVQLIEYVDATRRSMMILGGGSNILFKADFEGIVLRNEIGGIELVNEDPEVAIIRAGAGVNWNDLVNWAVARDYGGIENLTLIPGSTGAAPIQNIGAYGVELESVFLELEAVEIKTGSRMTFGLQECEFGYRDSVFKKSAKGRFVITSVSLKLSRSPVVNTSYGAVESELVRMGVDPTGISIKDVSDAVASIRRSKLPDPETLGNAGSFFKNPVIGKDEYLRLNTQYNDLPAYEQPDGSYKLAAGWLIEQCGWKGRRVGDAGVHEKQALVLVNHGNATGDDIFQLSVEVRDSVMEKFGIEINPEVNIIG